MKNLLIRIGALIVLLLSLARLCHAPDWEPLISFITALIAYIALDAWQTLHSISSNDKRLIQVFQELFSRDSGFVEFLREHDIAQPFHHRMTDPLLKFYDQWKGVHYEFDDLTLEKSKQRLMDKVKEYVPILVTETYAHTNNPNLRTMDFHDWNNSPEKMEIRKRLNDLGSEVLVRYEDFIRVVRRKYKKTEQAAS